MPSPYNRPLTREDMDEFFEKGYINQAEKDYWLGRDIDYFNEYLQDVNTGRRKRMGT